MTTVNIHEAKTHLSRLIDAAMKGEPFIIAEAGKPLVKVEAVEAVPSVDTGRRFGFMKSEFSIPDDFDTMMQDEIIELFEGRPDKFADLNAHMEELEPQAKATEKR